MFAASHRYKRLNEIKCYWVIFLSIITPFSHKLILYIKAALKHQGMEINAILSQISMHKETAPTFSLGTCDIEAFI